MWRWKQRLLSSAGLLTISRQGASPHFIVVVMIQIILFMFFIRLQLYSNHDENETVKKLQMDVCYRI